MPTRLSADISWSKPNKFIFRFIWIYTLLYTFPFPFNFLPFGQYITQWTDQFWKWLALPVARHLFHITDNLTLQGRGSGDTSLDYIIIFILLTMALVAALIWTLTDRKHNHYNTLFRYQVVYLRYYTALNLFVYAIVKIFPTQFWEPSLIDLTRSFGELSPMGLLWKFMGYSEAYVRFAGIAEALACIFLLFRNTERLGALIGFGVMLNVFVMNMSYDVPVKLFSFHLMFACGIILIAHFNAFLHFFIQNKTVFSQQNIPYTSRKTTRNAGYIFKTILILYVITNYSISSHIRYRKNHDTALLPALYGIYNTDDFMYNRDTLPPLLTDPIRWKQFIVDRNSAVIIKMDDTKIYMKNHTDTTQQRLTLTHFRDAAMQYHFRYTRIGDSILMLRGITGKDSIRMTLNKKDRKDFLLINRGFHWINEYPFNR